MEATRSRRKPRKRKPFTDLSNSIPSSSLPSSQSSSSSLLKPQTKSSLSLPRKSLLNNNLNSNLNSNPKFTATESTTNENVNNDKKKKDKEKVQIKKANPSSMLSPLPETPFVSVSNRRHTAEKRKSKEKEIAEPLSCSLETRMPGLSDNVNNDKKKEKEKSQSNKANPSSMLSPLPKVPSVSGIGDCVDFEPSTIFNRRHTAEKGKGKEKEIAEPLSCSFEARRPDLRKKKGWRWSY
ncbi:hypothetical protein REPUB_Repub13aG0123200 [Reevesia pubescens]